MAFLNSFQSEWLKTRRSLAAWLVVLGGTFVPILYTIAGLLKPNVFVSEVTSADFWEQVALQNWTPMAYLMLPMGIVLVTSLIAQLEFKNNAWKQVNTTPQYLTTIFFAKFAVIIVMLVQFLLLFNIGIYLSAVIPIVYFGHLDYPAQVFPWAYYAKINFWFLLYCMPIVVFQYLLSLNFKNFLVSLGIGICLVIASIICLPWKHGLWLPYTHLSYYMNQARNNDTPPFTHINLSVVSVAFTVLFIVAGYLSFYFKKERN